MREGCHLCLLRMHIEHLHLKCFFTSLVDNQVLMSYVLLVIQAVCTLPQRPTCPKDHRRLYPSYHYSIPLLYPQTCLLRQLISPFHEYMMQYLSMSMHTSHYVVRVSCRSTYHHYRRKKSAVIATKTRKSIHFHGGASLLLLVRG